MFRSSFWTALACAALLGAAMPGMAETYLGIYADSLGTTPCTTISPYSASTLYVIAKIDTAQMSGITAAEFRIEVSQPSGWYLTYYPPAGTGFGDPMDTLPDSSDTSGILIAFGSCRTPTGNRVLLGTILAINGGQGTRTELRVRRHSMPSNPGFQCPLFTDCDYQKHCLSGSTEPSCYFSKPSSLTGIGHLDPVTFVFDLDDTPRSESGFPGLVSKPAIVDRLGNVEGNEYPEIEFDSLTTVASWDFEGGSPCNTSGWAELDLRNVDWGEWGRLNAHITENDECTENTTCAWLWSDDVTPWLYNDPSMAFGPGGYVVHNWIDNVIVSPWVGLGGDLPLGETMLTFREFPGNLEKWSRIRRGYSVRGKTGAGAPSEWRDSRWADLSSFTWITRIEDISTLVDFLWDSLQVRFRVTDAQLLGGDPPSPYIPGPGPFLDDIRIGRTIHEAPVFSAGKGDSRWQAQDAFPASSQSPFAPTTSRFGTCAVSMSTDIGGNSPSVIRGDSIAVTVKDLGHGAVDTVRCFFSIVDGVHAGKVPPGATATAGGLCEWPATRRTNDRWFVDPPDNYFRGGDVVHYFWWASDDNPLRRGVASCPEGITEPSIDTYTLAEAEEATGGLFEVSFLPTIVWPTGYVAAVQADPEGDVEPTQAQIDSATQRSCILYVNKVNTERRTTDVHRTSFMYTLDQLGYRNESGVRYYDIYDLQGWGDTNNDLGSRAQPAQAQGYSLIVHDAGRSKFWPIPDGSDPVAAKVDQCTWYRTWLSNAPIGEAGRATLWVIGENVVETIASNFLIGTTMGVALRSSAVDADTLARLGFRSGTGGASFTWADGNGTLFRGEYSLNAGCPSKRDYDGLDANGSAVVTHHFFDEVWGDRHEGAVVMKATPAESYNTIMMAINWFDLLRFPEPNDETAKLLARQVLFGSLFGAQADTACLRSETLVDVAGVAPPVTRLYQNVPNPFNPRTTIGFDVATPGPVELRVYNVAGRLVRTLVNGPLAADRHAIVWDGKDDRGNRIGSGIYFYRLKTGEFLDTKKLVMMK